MLSDSWKLPVLEAPSRRNTPHPVIFISFCASPAPTATGYAATMPWHQVAVFHIGNVHRAPLPLQ